MRLIILSPPENCPRELRLVERILRRTAVTFHLRKPGRGAGEVADYLQQIPADLHRRIMVHGHRELLDRFDLKGIHFPENERRCHPQRIRQLRQQRPDCRISSAFHRISDLSDTDNAFDYIFLSPVFDSISKRGTRAAFNHGDLKRFLSQTAHMVIALGGIDAQQVATAAALGFRGIAVLGAVWNAPAPETEADSLSSICHRFNHIRK
jgi:thiamine-phosphate pyrophosphorylase